MKFAYADPPYFKQGKRLYGALHDDADIWDAKQAHWDLIDRLMAEYPDGWALSRNRGKTCRLTCGFVNGFGIV